CVLSVTPIEPAGRDMWINVVESNARAFGWSDNMTKYQALQKLRKTAKIWLDSLQKYETSWTKWKWRQWRDTLSDTFRVSRNMFNSLKELIDTNPSLNQSLYELYFEQKSKIDRLQLGFRHCDIISIIVGSIGDVNISVAAEAEVVWLWGLRQDQAGKYVKDLVINNAVLKVLDPKFQKSKKTLIRLEVHSNHHYVVNKGRDVSPTSHYINEGRGAHYGPGRHGYNSVRISHPIIPRRDAVGLSYHDYVDRSLRHALEKEVLSSGAVVDIRLAYSYT
ncbi:jg19762, partial [Pararge aegeria aegeria]